MTQVESQSVTSFIFISNLQQLAITQASFEPEATLKPGVISRKSVQENSIKLDTISYK
jgi:hypothetical protein